MSAISLRAYVAVTSRLGSARRGATAVEYGLLLALIVAVVMSAMAAFGSSTSGLYAKLAAIAGLIKS